MQTERTPLATERQQCIMCDKGFGRDICSGCKNAFCGRHYEEHRHKLNGEMDNIGLTHDTLQSYLTAENMANNHPLVERINKWEERSINRIRQVAHDALAKFKRSLDRIKRETMESLIQVAGEMKISRESEDYTEMELTRWMKQLESLKQRLQSLPMIELCDDTQNDGNASIIRLIKLKVHQEPSK
jgi:uncharacterized UBP type Zn finger protein